MRIFLLFYIVIFSFLPVAQAVAQSFQGKVKNDTAFISIQITAFKGWEQVAAGWGVPVAGLQQNNPDITNASEGKAVDLMIPVSHLLRNDSSEGCRAVYHSVGKSEGLYRIGKWYGNQPVSVLKARNKLRSDALKPGQQLLVGYILAPDPETAASVPVVTEIIKTDTSSTLPDSLSAAGRPVPKPAPPRKVLVYTGEGIFMPEFLPAKDGAVKRTGKASSFKSESGWTDGRFYALQSNLKPGTVIRIINPATGIVLYAKVVGPLPDIKQNNGLSIRLSSAAAAMLGYWEEDGAFEVTWEY